MLLAMKREMIGMTRLSRSKWGRWLALAAVSLTAMTGCARFRTSRGVEPDWRDATVPQFERGVSTSGDVMQALGPPSQIIPLNGGAVYYYLHEQGKGKAMILLAYNTSDFNVTYDRAIFFFDAAGSLTEYAYSHQANE